MTARQVLKCHLFLTPKCVFHVCVLSCDSEEEDNVLTYIHLTQCLCVTFSSPAPPPAETFVFSLLTLGNQVSLIPYPDYNDQVSC